MNKIVLVLVLIWIAASASIVSVASADNVWVTKASLQVGRGGLGTSVVNGYIYAIGGATTEGNVGTNERYDPMTNTWTLQAAMPTPRTLFAIVAFQSKIYCIGGAISSEGATSANEIFDPSSNSWKSAAPMPTPRYELQANLVNGKIYCIGGTTENGRSTNINEVYDPLTNTWATDTPLPNATSIYASAVFDDKIYIIGGVTPSDKLNQIFDPITHRWTSGVPPPEGGIGSAAVVTGFNATMGIYVFNNRGTNQIYDPKTDTWTTGAPVPIQNLVKFGTVAVNDTIYIIGGSIWNKPYPLSDYVEEIPSAQTLEYLPIGYGTPDPTYIEVSPPKICITSPLNQTYNGSTIPLLVTVDKPVNWSIYSLDGRANVSFTGNSTLTDIPNGSHSLVIYSQDIFGNVCTSEVNFQIHSPPFPIMVAGALSVTVGLAACLLILVYLYRNKTARNKGIH